MSIRDKYKDNFLAEWDYRLGTSLDQSGNAVNPVATDVFMSSAEVGRAVNFNEDTSQLAIPSTAVGNDHTLVVFGNCKSVNLADNVMLGNESGGTLMQFDLNDADSLRVYYQEVIPNSIETPIVASDYENKWTVYGLTRSGTTTKMFTNGNRLSSDTQTGTISTGKFGLIGNIVANTKKWDGQIAYAAILNTPLTDEEMAQFAEEIRATRPYSDVQLESSGRYRNILSDGDMQDSGTDSWGTRNSATLTKETDVDGRYLKVAYNGTTAPGATQSIFEIGKTYRFTGEAIGDGAFDPKIYTGSGAAIKTNFGTITTWTEFDVVWTADNTTVAYSTNASSAGWSGWRNLNVYECELDGTPKYTQIYTASGKGWNETISTATSGFISNTGWNIDSAAPNSQFNIVSGDGDGVKVFKTTGSSACVAGIASNQVYGTWEWDVYRDSDASELRLLFCANKIATTTDSGLNCYQLRINATNRIAFSKRTGGVDTALGYTDSGYVENDKWYRLRITRSKAGEFRFYVKGQAFTDWTFVDVTGGGGTNPVADTSFTTSNYIVVDNDGRDDMIGNFRIIPYIE